MENTTEFDLDKAIVAWREDLVGSPAFRSSDVDELECHLRDSVATLRNVGLSPKEAFWVARSRLGPGSELRGEFEKLNSKDVWLYHVLWMVTGSLVIGAISTLVSSLTSYGTLAAYELTRQSQLLGPITLALYVLLFLGLFLFTWKSAQQSDGKVRRFASWMRSHPFAAAVIVFLFTVFSQASIVGANALTFRAVPNGIYTSLVWWRYPALLASVVISPIVLAWLLVRTNRKAIFQ